MEFVLLESFDNYIDANLVLGRMQEAGINCWLKDENTATLYPILLNAIGGIKLMVDKEELLQAIEILNALKEIKSKSFSCPYCGSNNIEYITSPKKAINIISSFLTWLLGNYAIGAEKVWHCFECGKEFEHPVSNDELLQEE